MRSSLREISAPEAHQLLNSWKVSGMSIVVLGTGFINFQLQATKLVQISEHALRLENSLGGISLPIDEAKFSISGAMEIPAEWRDLSKIAKTVLQIATRNSVMYLIEVVLVQAASQETN